jgi:hypothetical protein
MAERSTLQSGRTQVWLKRLAYKILGLLLAGLLLGWTYQWVEPRLYGADSKAVFGIGVIHGALMPVALPSLLMGHDAAIYAPNNSGRGYKIGYICGINLCGFLFFGIAFWKPNHCDSGPVQYNQSL